MATSLVTGGAGFIGSHLADSLLDKGHQVVVVDDLSGGFRDNVPQGATFVEGDVSDHECVAAVFSQHQFDYVFHFAAYAAEGLSHFIRRYNYTNNLLASANLINASVAAEVRCFVFASSIAVYGSPEQLPLSEEHTPRPEDPYGVAKLAVEHDLHCAHLMFGLPYVIFRPHNVYGERQNIGDHYRNVVGIFMNQILNDQPMSVFGDGQQRRAFSYIRDVAPIMAQVVERPDSWNQVYNVGADEHVSVNELAEQVARAMDAPHNVRHLPARNEVKFAYSTHQRIREEFECPPETPLHEGLRLMAQWVRRQGARTGKPFDGLEITRNFPEAWQHLLAQQPDLRKSA